VPEPATELMVEKAMTGTLLLPGDGRDRLDLAGQQGAEDDLGAFLKRLPGRRRRAFGVPPLSLVISSMSGSVASNMASSPPASAPRRCARSRPVR
jgi:hypothetical protein